MASARLLIVAVLATAALLMLHGAAFVGGSGNIQRSPTRSLRIAAAAEGSSGLSLPVFEETEENHASASVVFYFVLGLVFPVLHGFNFALILAAIGYGLTNGGLAGFAKKTEATKEYAGTVEEAGVYSVKAGSYSLKAYNFVATKAKELTA
ncbi:unnamed protein product [Polarella glacialis]|uniref:Uncharacterized protein n=1 Tax=Polarella glacialis TaxID=89957 RepID=A0A813IR07_POLGL|nr:unnamed protein product [Polarella glacialis]CAE8656183.1 unnamed protein product [Polarella glacialis]|eukprot:CAMPEP_0115078330 /NCGR_PEP_ID=MMETSP0227-20121206/17495_1 /TAXON_ID=89957 /ORGANISM="Polarella glacialis, Strain CCMP 1383" /LENGTH=150 /DNA_ID=CAMNT_0002465715 /DNA_START=59 /DNA_END=511 /DNA_ORIENTATION=-